VVTSVTVPAVGCVELVLRRMLVVVLLLVDLRVGSIVPATYSTIGI
jgi:hypothetical protein